MKLKLFFILVLLLTTANLYSQNSKIKVEIKEVIAGHNLINQDVIKGTEYIFPKRIQHSYIDTESGLLTITMRELTKNGKKLKNSGKIIFFDLNKKQVNWAKPMMFQVANLAQYNKTLIYSTSNKSFCLDIYNGKKLWKVKNDIYYVESIYNIGIGYKYRSISGESHQLEGIDLSNGHVLWKNQLKRDYGWDDVFYLNDTTLLIIAGGLHTRNIKTGEGWAYDAITGNKNYTEAAVTNVVGATLGVLTGTFVTSAGYSLVRKIYSNVIIDSCSLYFASMEKISRINKTNGQAMWATPLSKKLTSNSSIFRLDSLLYLVNYGSAFRGNKKINYGEPYIAAFNQNTGEQKYNSSITLEKNPIRHFGINQDSLQLIFKDRILTYSLTKGEQITETIFDQEKYGELKFIIGDNFFVANQDSTFSPLKHRDTTKTYIATSQDKVLIINKALEVIEEVDYDDIYIHYLTTKGYKFIAQKKQTFILDKNLTKIAEITANKRAILIKDKLYNSQEKSYLEIDLKGIVKY